MKVKENKILNMLMYARIHFGEDSLKLRAKNMKKMSFLSAFWKITFSDWLEVVMLCIFLFFLVFFFSYFSCCNTL